MAPGIPWVTIVFASVLALGRTFLVERENGCIDGLPTSPLDRGSIFLAKLAVHTLLLLAVVQATEMVLAGASLDNLGLMPIAARGTRRSADKNSAKSELLRTRVVFYGEAVTRPKTSADPVVAWRLCENPTPRRARGFGAAGVRGENECARLEPTRQALRRGLTHLSPGNLEKSPSFECSSA
jgi:hypothetical protein